VRLLKSVRLQGPLAVGWTRSVILLPVTAVPGLPSDQLEAILAHELAHIKRFDYLVNLGQSAVETLLFYDPGVWWISGCIP
jgi:beta-lactamase regulating signal transducer with metallopeptidase domain